MLNYIVFLTLAKLSLKQSTETPWQMI